MDTWASGSSWYRKYKSGWVEQGGVVDNGVLARSIGFNIAFHIPFENARTYSIQAMPERVPAGNNAGAIGMVLASTTHAQIWFWGIDQNLARYLRWSAAGQSAN